MNLYKGDRDTVSRIGETEMTVAEKKKLDTIIGKLEALQNSCANLTQKEKDAMRAAKSRLLEILWR